MNKRDIIIDILPFVLWMLIFVFCVFGFEELDISSYIIIVLFFLLPIFISIYNAVSSEDCDDLWIKNIFMGASNIIGILFSSAFSNCFVECDPEMEPVLSLVLVVTLIYTVLLTLICCGVKRLLKKRS